jgi:hypothetical protein
MRVCVLLLGLASLAAALPSHPATITLKARPAANNLALRGGGCPHLVSTSAAITGAQGAFCAFAPKACYEAYGGGIPPTGKKLAFVENMGANLLTFSAFSSALFFGLSPSKSVAVACIPFLCLTVRWLTAHSKIEGINVNSAAVKAWMVIAAGLAYTAWNEGAGLMDANDLVKCWAAFAALNAIAPLLFFDKWAELYGVSTDKEDEKLMLQTAFTWNNLMNAALMYGSTESPLTGIMWAWGVNALANLIGIVKQDWRTFRQPNGVLGAIWCLLSAAISYSAYISM